MITAVSKSVMADCGAFEAEDIVKYGDMMIKRPPTSAKVRIKVSLCFIPNMRYIILFFILF